MEFRREILARVLMSTGKAMAVDTQYKWALSTTYTSCSDTHTLFLATM